MLLTPEDHYFSLKCVSA